MVIYKPSVFRDNDITVTQPVAKRRFKQDSGAAQALVYVKNNLPGGVVLFRGPVDWMQKDGMFTFLSSFASYALRIGPHYLPIQSIIICGGDHFKPPKPL